MSNFEQIKKLNPDKEIHSIDEDIFSEYGEAIADYDNSSVSKVMDAIKLPTDFYYKIANPALEADSEIQKVGANVYAGMPFVAGECVGNSSDLPHSEFHGGSEVNIYQNDVVMALGKRKNVHNNKYNPAKDAKLFFIPAGTAVEMYGDTLHFAPFKVEKAGFKFVVMLLKGTNEELPTGEKFANPLIAKEGNFFFGYDDGSMIGEQLTVQPL